MTNEELERAMDFLLKGQARFDARLEAYVQEGKERQDRTDEQIAQTNEALKGLSARVDAFADTQAELMRVFTMYMKSEEQNKKIAAARQARLDETITRTNESMAATQARSEEAQARVNESLTAQQARAEESQARINESLRASLDELASKQTKTEEALARLADAQAQSERRMDALTKIVEEERGRR